MFTIVDQTEFFKNKGIKLVDVYADASTEKNAEYREFIDKGTTEGIKQWINVLNDEFLSNVESARGDRLKQGKEVWGTGKLFFANEAVDVGLVDEIMPWQEAVQFMLDHQ